MKFWTATLLANTVLAGLGVHVLGVHQVLAAVCLVAPVVIANTLLIGNRYPPPPRPARAAPPAPERDYGLDILDPRDGDNSFAWDNGRHART